ncbi:MAG: outer membrane protein assembly factor BamE [Burkholderiaceae bacterium]|nr:outer membrane protein assembly factor BamE [Burkholderiaceae bacterium]
MIRILLSTAAAALLAGCASQLQTSQTLFGLVTPYRMELVQGNVITQELLARVRPGLNRRQVRDLLGTPLLTDVFHGNRWDYVFVIERQGRPAQRRNIVLRFDGDVLASIDAGELPTEQQFVSSITREAKYPDRKLELTEEERAALPKPPARAASAAEPSGPVRPYPPLEGE